MDRPLIFLDCDGVVNCIGTFMKRALGSSLYVHDPILLARVQRLAEEYDAQIVVSSTWRKLHDRKAFAALFPAWVGERLHPIWRTPDLGTRRGHEVRKWFDEAFERGFIGREFPPYVILDDDADFLPGQHLIQTSYQTGITNLDVAAARVCFENQMRGVKAA